MAHPFNALIDEHLQKQKAQSRWRQRTVTPRQIDFQSNDYLGLSRHPGVIERFHSALREYGAGSGGSPLIGGYNEPHAQLESEIASWLGVEAVVLFSSGFAANCGLMQVLTDAGAHFYVDKLCHASVYSQLMSNPARLHRFAHNDTSHLAEQLNNADPAQLKVISTEGIFSMDGHAAALQDILTLTENRDDIILHIDDAHGIGVTGEKGRGVLGLLPGDLLTLPIIITGTFGKAFGQSGAFIGGSQRLSDLLVNRCKHLIYSTSFSPAQAAALSEVLSVLASAEGEHLRILLNRNIHCFRNTAKKLQLDTYDSQSAIQPLLAVSETQAMYVSKALAEQGLTIKAIRPPTVPVHKSRLRITLNAMHDETEIEHLLTSVRHIIDSTGYQAL